MLSFSFPSSLDEPCTSESYLPQAVPRYLWVSHSLLSTLYLLPRLDSSLADVFVRGTLPIPSLSVSAFLVRVSSYVLAEEVWCGVYARRGLFWVSMFAWRPPGALVSYRAVDLFCPCQAHRTLLSSLGVSCFRAPPLWIRFRGSLLG